MHDATCSMYFLPTLSVAGHLCHINVHNNCRPTSSDRNSNCSAPRLACRTVASTSALMASTTAPFSSALAKKNTAFYDLMAHINCTGRMTLSQWEGVFGEVTEQNPWGDRFWEGLKHLMMTEYRPRMRKQRHLCNLVPTLAYFELPDKFAKAAARQAKHCECNPGSGQLYPAWAWYQCQPPQGVWIVCINICIRHSAPWFVDSSWITPLDALLTASSSEPPSYTTSSTVVIEEV